MTHLPPNGRTIYHFGVHNAEADSPIAVNANAGDTLLFQATRDLFDSFFGTHHWKLAALWEEVTPERVRAINTEGAAVLIGGGGLFLRDQAGAVAANSGWQWNASPERLVEFRIPLIVFGVGYNRFRGQAEFDPVFKTHINTLVSKSTFFGLRNSGSVRAIRGYLDANQDRVALQPCPTTLAWYLYPLFRGEDVPGRKNLAVNVAFDRRELRFPDEGRILGDIAGEVKELSENGWSVTLANHKPGDAEFGSWLERAGVPFRSSDLAASYPEDILSFYRDQDLVIAMRGHAQMIPFGLRKPVLSVISHDKLRWFLEDIGYPGWGVDVTDPVFSRALHDAVIRLTGDNNVPDAIAACQQRLWDITKTNMQAIATSTGWTLRSDIASM